MVVIARNHSRLASALPQAKASCISRPAAKSRCAGEWRGWGRSSNEDRAISITRTRARAPGAEGDPPSMAGSH